MKTQIINSIPANKGITYPCVKEWMGAEGAYQGRLVVLFTGEENDIGRGICLVDFNFNNNKKSRVGGSDDWVSPRDPQWIDFKGDIHFEN
jgi:hypothetical protein